MKRIMICSVLLLGAVAVSIFSYLRVDWVNTELNLYIEAVEMALQSGDNEKITEQAERLNKFWEKEETVLIHFVRHSHIDSITTSAERLPALARFEDFGEVNAELANIRRQMEHVLHSEVLSFGSLL